MEYTCERCGEDEELYQCEQCRRQLCEACYGDVAITLCGDCRKVLCKAQALKKMSRECKAGK